MSRVPIFTMRDLRRWVNSKEFDNALDLPIVYAKDDEGNGYDRFLNQPCVMENVEIENDHELRDKPFKKAVCVN